MNNVSEDVFSFFDTGVKDSLRQPERFYHGFVLGLLVELRGRGIEFKVKRKREKSLEETADNALKQIDEKEYERELTAKGFAKEKIMRYGFAFEGKKVLIKKR